MQVQVVWAKPLLSQWRNWKICARASSIISVWHGSHPKILKFKWSACSKVLSTVQLCVANLWLLAMHIFWYEKLFWMIFFFGWVILYCQEWPSSAASWNTMMSIRQMGSHSPSAQASKSLFLFWCYHLGHKHFDMAPNKVQWKIRELNFYTTFIILTKFCREGYQIMITTTYYG